MTEQCVSVYFFHEKVKTKDLVGGAGTAVRSLWKTEFCQTYQSL